jgi:hypothetical protein
MRSSTSCPILLILSVSAVATSVNGNGLLVLEALE